MYLIALGSMSYAVWTMVQMRRIKRGDEVDESDQTAEVVQNMQSKTLPEIASGVQVTQNVQQQVVQSTIQTPVSTAPPLPPTGLPEGWTMEQWSHYGQQYLENQQ